MIDELDKIFKWDFVLEVNEVMELCTREQLLLEATCINDFSWCTLASEIFYCGVV